MSKSRISTPLFAGAFAAVFGLLGATQSAEARGWRRHHRGAPIVAGIAGGLALGAIAAGAYGYGYRYRPHYRSCWDERRPVYNRWGDFRGYRFVRVCN